MHYQQTLHVLESYANCLFMKRHIPTNDTVLNTQRQYLTIWKIYSRKEDLLDGKHLPLEMLRSYRPFID